MDIGAFIVLMVKIVAAAIVIFILSLAGHELGHLIGGLVKGYKPLYYEVFGLTFQRKAPGKKKVAYYKGMPAGQCVMVADSVDSDPAFLVLGGVIANMLFGLLSVMVLFCYLVSQPDVISELMVSSCIIAFFTNAVTFVLNYYSRSETGDGITYRLIKEDIRNTRIYNRITLISERLYLGDSFGSVGAELFDCENYKGSLANEIRLYKVIADSENLIDEPKTLSELVREAKGTEFEEDALIEKEIRASIESIKKGETKKPKITSINDGNKDSRDARVELLMCLAGIKEVPNIEETIFSGEIVSVINTLRKIEGIKAKH